MVTIEPPRISGDTEKARLTQLESYLHRTAQQLQWAFDTLEGNRLPAAAAEQPIQPAPSFSSQAVFAGIKNLIIKSADIVNAYSARITKQLEGTYTAKSEFGTFAEKTTQALNADSRRLEQLFSSQQTLRETVEGLYDQAVSAEAYLRTGLLYRDREGQPVYGLEIGQKNQVDGQTVFDRFARFTASRLSFFDSANVEVAYISDYKLFITNAEITGSLRMGGNFRIYSGRGLIFQWTGGTEHGGSV